jgi:hypothetical protein
VIAKRGLAVAGFAGNSGVNLLRVQRLALLGLLLGLLLALDGCAAMDSLSPGRARLAVADVAEKACLHWFGALDAAVDSAGVADIASRRVADFPYLRSDRFTASLAGPAASDEAAFDAWITRMRALDADGRRVEIANLPPAALEAFGVSDRDAALARSADCADRLARIDLGAGAQRALLAQRTRVADDYSLAKRVFGLYPLTQLPFALGIDRWEQEAIRAFRASRGGQPPRHPVTVYVPASQAGYSRDEVAALLARAGSHPLGLPELSAAERDRLFATHAPVFEVETSGDFDRIGTLFWGAPPAPEVDLSRPAVYRKLGYTRVGGQTLVQLTYVAWMPARPKDHALDLLGGRLDGLIWRVTLAPDGAPVLFDTIHPCGCFHMFFPTPRVQPLPAPSSLIEWAFSPATLPVLAEKERVVVSVQTRSHYLRNVAPAGELPGIEYAFADYDDLRVLPLPGGGSRSAFGPDGLVPGTQRGERFLFWPMGIASAGQMRQWGTHATAFVGRRHFDDADLIDRRFRLLP